MDSVVEVLRSALPQVPPWAWLALLGGGVLLANSTGVLAVLWRCATGAPADGKARTDASWWRPGTVGVGEFAEGTVSWWALRPRGVRMGIRWGFLVGLGLTLYGLSVAQTLTVVLLVMVLVAVSVWLVWRGVRSWSDRRFQQRVVRPLAEALGAHLPTMTMVERVAALSVPREPSKENPIRLMLPDGWEGTDAQKQGLTSLVARRMGGEWLGRWQHTQSPFSGEFRPRLRRRQLPTMVRWEPSRDPHKIMVGVGHTGPIYVNTRTETPHWGVSAGTGGGKTTSLLIPLIHHRQHGALIDVIDLKEESFDEAVEGVSGVRVHRNARSAVMALAEFFTSMKSMYSARAAGYDAEIPDRILVLDEFGSFILAARTWWKHGVKGKNEPPFMAWFHMSLMQGRTKNHRMVIGAHQFSLDIFGSTDARDLVGSKIVVGPCSPSKWTVSFGAGTPRPEWDSKIPGRGVIGITGQQEIEEIQIAFFTLRETNDMLKKCAPAPFWFDRGDIAPWITENGIQAADEEGAVRDFLPGGKYVTRVTHPDGTGDDPSSDAVTASSVTTAGDSNRMGGGQRSVINSAGGHQLPAVVSGELCDDSEPFSPGRSTLDAGPRTYTLREATEEGILPVSYDALKQRRSRAKKAGIPLPEGISVLDGPTQYTTQELREWWATILKPSPQHTQGDPKYQNSTIRTL